jgi:hypothetical protein
MARTTLHRRQARMEFKTSHDMKVLLSQAAALVGLLNNPPPQTPGMKDLMALPNLPERKPVLFLCLARLSVASNSPVGRHGVF